MKDVIIKALEKVSGEDNINLTFTENEKHGDYSTNIALVSAKANKKNPQELAKEYIQKLLEDNTLMHYVSEVKVAGAGFINFYLKTEYMEGELEEIKKKGVEYGKSEKNKGKKVIVEYSSPNIAKPFTIGHLRSTIIGDAIANLLSSTGWSVYRDNHLGDWGTQFGKQIYAIKTWGENKENFTVKELVALYVKFHEEAEKDPALEDRAREWFKKLETGDSEARDLWQKCVDWSWKEFEQIYQILGIKFSENNGRGFGESYFEDKMSVVIDELKEKNQLEEGEEGAKLVFFENDKYPPLMVLKKDGSTLYATRDLATDKFRLSKYGSDVYIVNEVGAEQTLYFQQLFELEKMLGWVKPGQRVHIKHGHFRFADKKMSTRKGNVIWLEDVLSEAVSRAKKLGSETEELAKTVAVGALKWNELKRDPISDIVFNWDEILNMQGNSGPYLQYTYARTQSVLEKAKNKKGEFNNSCGGTLYPEEHSVMRLLARFGEVIETSAQMYSPSTLANYLFELAQSYNSFYNKHKIIESQKEEFRLLLTNTTGIVLKNGLAILGIETPLKM